MWLVAVKVSDEQKWVTKGRSATIILKNIICYSRSRWEDNIKSDLQEVGGIVGTGWSGLRIGTGGGHL
jgi:high-affinity nickel permease